MYKRNILICTQKVDKNDDLLGFFHSWIAEFAKNCETVTVVCLFRGEVDLPANVKVLSLGKERCDFRFSIFDFRFISRMRYFFRFYKYIWQERRNYDTVFVHMNPIYVLLGGIFWKIWQKKIGLWYAHGHAPWELRIAEKMVDDIFTSTASGCRIQSKKIRIVGQGIDTNKFLIKSEIINHKSEIKLITIGRISPVKDLETLIKAIEVLVKKNIDIRLDIIGAIGLAEQKAYHDSLLKLIKDKELDDYIKFIGSVPNTKIINYLQASDIFVSASQTGSLDKTFLEAMACGLPVFGCNVALNAVLGEYKNLLLYPAGDFMGLSKKIEDLINLSDEEFLRMQNGLRQIVVNEHSLPEFVKKILRIK